MKRLPGRSPRNAHTAPYWCLMVESPDISTRKGSAESPSLSAISASWSNFGCSILFLNRRKYTWSDYYFAVGRGGEQLHILIFPAENRWGFSPKQMNMSAQQNKSWFVKAPQAVRWRRHMTSRHPIKAVERDKSSIRTEPTLVLREPPVKQGASRLGYHQNATIFS